MHHVHLERVVHSVDQMLRWGVEVELDHLIILVEVPRRRSLRHVDFDGGSKVLKLGRSDPWDGDDGCCRRVLDSLVACSRGSATQYATLDGTRLTQIDGRLVVTGSANLVHLPPCGRASFATIAELADDDLGLARVQLPWHQGRPVETAGSGICGEAAQQPENIDLHVEEIDKRQMNKLHSSQDQHQRMNCCRPRGRHKQRCYTKGRNRTFVYRSFHHEGVTDADLSRSVRARKSHRPKSEYKYTF